MILHTRALVLSALKYSETSLIVKCFTEQKGTQSYILKGILKPKKMGLTAAYFQGLNQLEIVATHSEGSKLHYIKEAKITYHYQQLHQNMVKNTVAFFLCEITNKLLSNAMEDTALFNFIVQYLQWYDLSLQHANFHLKYLTDLTQYLGIAPNVTHMHLPFFDIEEGTFVTLPQVGYSLSEENTSIFRALLQTNLTNIAQIHLNKHQRNAILEALLRYYTWHLPDFRIPKSWTILRELSDT